MIVAYIFDQTDAQHRLAQPFIRTKMFAELVPWIAVAFITFLNLIIIYLGATRTFTKIRIRCIVGGLLLLGLSITNALRNYDKQLDDIYSSIHFPVSTLFLIVITLIAMDFGSSFNIPGGSSFQYSRRFYHSASGFLGLFVFTAVVDLIKQYHNDVDGIISLVFVEVVSGILATASTVCYIYLPLVYSKRGQKDGVSEPFIIGIW